VCLLVPSVLLALTLSTSQNLNLAANICTPHLIFQLHRGGRTGLTANCHDHDGGSNKNRPWGWPLLLMSSYVSSFSPTCLKYRALKHSATAVSPSSQVPSCYAVSLHTSKLAVKEAKNKQIFRDRKVNNTDGECF
jgi:hypothetical protein